MKRQDLFAIHNAVTVGDEVLDRLPTPDEAPTIGLYKTDDLLRALQWAEGRDHEAKARIRKSLEGLGEPTRTLITATHATLPAIQKLAVDFPNFGRVARWIGDQIVLQGLGDNVVKLPPVLLSGSPGIGKTEFANRLAVCLGTKFWQADLSKTQSSSALAGSDPHWGNSSEGLVWTWLSQTDHANCMVFLDEVDKTASMAGQLRPATNALYSLLEKRSAERFLDAAQPMLPIDASHIIWIAACNDPDSLEAPLLQRFKHFRIQAPDLLQSRIIITNIYSRIREAAPWGSVFADTLPADVIDILSALPPRLARRKIEDAFAAAARAKRNHIVIADVTARGSEEPVVKRRMGFM